MFYMKKLKKIIEKFVKTCKKIANAIYDRKDYGRARINLQYVPETSEIVGYSKGFVADGKEVAIVSEDDDNRKINVHYQGEFTDEFRIKITFAVIQEYLFPPQSFFYGSDKVCEEYAMTFNNRNIDGEWQNLFSDKVEKSVVEEFVEYTPNKVLPEDMEKYRRVVRALYARGDAYVLYTIDIIGILTIKKLANAYFRAKGEKVKIRYRKSRFWVSVC